MLRIALLCLLLLRSCPAHAPLQPACPPGQRILVPASRRTSGPPPAQPPEDLRWAYTRCGAIPVADYYVDDSRGGRGTRYSHSRKDIAQRVAGAAAELAHARPLVAAGGQASRAHLLRALQLPLLQGLLRAGNASVVVFGSTAPTVEALLLAAGAARVLTVEYNELVYDHAGLLTARPSEVAEAWGAGNHSRIPGPRTFDLALSISSFDHDGLGRYGDPLAPDGDLLAMDGMARYLKPGALALVTVPVGPDRLWWNLMRTYGRVRLPLLLEGWEVLERVGWRGGAELEDAPAGNGGGPGKSHEPVFVLQRSRDSQGEL
jgi:SAM-dependent methyltransferase